MKITEAEQNRLVIEHQDLVGAIASGYRGIKEIPFGELEREGMLGLVVAARNFNSTKSSFVTYATIRIHGHIKDFIERWQVMDQLDDVSDEDEDRIHEWQIWGIFPAEGYRRLPASPEDIMFIYESVASHQDLDAAKLSLSRRERKMIAALFNQKPRLPVDQIARNMKCSYFDAVSTLYVAVKKLCETVKRIEQNKFKFLLEMQAA